MYQFILFVFILLAIIFLIGLVFFLRYVILKKNIGCGFSGLFIMIVSALTIYFTPQIMSYQSENSFICDFEYNTKLSYPVSGKIIEKRHIDAFNILGDFEDVAIIKMDTLDYNKILQNIQSIGFELDNVENKKMTVSFILKNNISVNEFDCVYKKRGYELRLWFHKNKQIIIYEYINN